MKENKKPKLQTTNYPKFYSLLGRPPLPLRLQVFIEEMPMLEECKDRKIWLFLNLNPPLSSNLIFDVDIQF